MEESEVLNSFTPGKRDQASRDLEIESRKESHLADDHLSIPSTLLHPHPSRDPNNLNSLAREIGLDLAIRQLF